MITPQTLKGFRDFLPGEAVKRQYVIEIIRKTFELYGFEPIETPAIEYLEVFTGNIGEDEKLFYKFTDTGGREVALRYDQTVPTCRFLAEHSGEIILPFKRYQIQTVWRAEKPQKGRYREFLQCDADIFGVENAVADGETIALSIDIYRKLGFKKPVAVINDRELYKDFPYKAIVAIDKLQKIGPEGVIAELISKGYSRVEAEKLLNTVNGIKPNERLKNIFSYLDNLGMKDNYRHSPTLARSFSYSSGPIWEIVAEEFKGGSLLGGERYDSLVSRFSEKSVAGTGFAVGFDRTVLAMDELGLLPKMSTKTKVLVTVFNQSSLPASQKITLLLRESGINTDLFPDPAVRLDKQLKFADRKGIPYAVIIGPKEMENNTVTLKDLKSKSQLTLPQNELAAQIKKPSF